MKKKLKARVLSALISASMVLNCILAYAAPLSDGTVNQQETQDESQLDIEVYDVFTPYNATLNAETEIEGDVAAYKVINERFTVDGIMYKEIGPGEAQVIGASGEQTEITIKDTVVRSNQDGSTESYDTISIGDSAFANCDEIISVTIELPINGISEMMFADCDNLEEVNLPNSVQVIARSAFSGCEELLKIDLSNVTAIGDYAFAECSKLTNVTLTSIETMGSYVFRDCEKLTTIEFKNLTENLAESSEGLTAIPEGAFYGCSRLSSIILPESVKSIGNYAFYDCKRLTKVALSSEITEIPDYAFSFCTSLQEIGIENSNTGTVVNNLTKIKRIGEKAFGNCVKLKMLTLGNVLEEICAYAFYNCSGFYDYYWDYVDSLDSYAWGQDEDASIYSYRFQIPESVTKIGERAFLAENNTIPCNTTNENVARLCAKSSYYYGSYNVTVNGKQYDLEQNSGGYDIECDGLHFNIIENTSTVELVGYDHDDGPKSLMSMFSENGNTEYWLPSEVFAFELGNRIISLQKLEGVKVQDSEGSIISELRVYSGNNEKCYAVDSQNQIYNITYNGGPYLIGDVPQIIGNATVYKVVRIADSALKGKYFYSGNIVVVPETIIEIGDEAFRGAYSYDDVMLVLPNTLESIGDRAFADLRGFSYIWICKVDSDGEDFDYPTEDELLNLIFSEQDTKLPGMKIGEQAFAQTTYMSPNDPDFYGNELVSVEIIANVGELGKGAFENQVMLEGVFFVYGDMQVPDYAFKNCESLMYVQLPLEFGMEYGNYGFKDRLSVNEIGAYAFSGCNNLQTFDIINGGLNVEPNPTIVIPEEITKVGEGAFANCTNIGAVCIEGSIDIPASMFEGCSNLTEVYSAGEKMEMSLKARSQEAVTTIKIGDRAFAECESLESVQFRDNIEHIGNYAFINCVQLNISTIPDSVKQIGRKAFYGCALDEVEIGSGLEAIGDNAFDSNVELKTNSSKTQLVLVEYLNREKIPTATWNGNDNIEPGAIVTLDGDIIADGENDITIGRNAQVYFGDVDTVTINGNVTLARDAIIHIPEGKTLVIASGAKINGVAANTENSNGVEDGALYIEGSVECFGNIGTNVALYKKLTKNMVAIDTNKEYVLGSEDQDPVPTVTFTLNGFTQTYTSGKDKDYSCTYSGNDRAGTAYVVLKANKNGRLLGGEVKIPYQIKKADPSVSVVSKVEGTNVTITATVDKKTAASGGRDRVEIKATRQVSGSEKQNVLLKTLWLNEEARTESSKTKTVSYTWENVYNGTYNIEVVYSGDANHNLARNTDGTFTVTEHDSNRPSGGGSGDGGNGGNGGGSIGGVGGSTIMPPIDHTDDEKPDYGILTLDPIKGLIGSKYGIITSNYDSHRSHWELDEISALIWGGSADNYWKLQYRDGSYAAGSKAIDENGKTYENYHWEFINKKWWAFDSDGFAKVGWLYDENYDGWFYIHIKHGMQTGWICVGDKWYYMNPDTAGCEGKMYAAQWTPDGYYVDESGAWDGRPQMLNAQ